MLMTLERKNWILICGISSTILLIMCFVYQLILEYKLCNLCLYARLPHIIIPVISLIYFFNRNVYWYLIIKVLLIIASIIALYHILIINDILSYTESYLCQNKPFSFISDDIPIMQDIQPCNITPKFLGLYLPYWNLMLCIGLLLSSICVQDE